MTDIALVAAKRTPIGRFLGSLKDLTAVDLACAAGEAALAGLDRRQIDLVMLGNILAAGQGMNIARQVGVKLGLPIEVPAYTVNMMCGSGLQTVLLAAQAIRAGEVQTVLCGGTESMTNAPYLLPRARSGYRLGDGTLVDAILRDGLVDSFDHRHMAQTAEVLARDYGISRTEQDEFAVRSQSLAAAAQKAGAFADELIPVGGLTADEHPRPETTVAKLATLKPSFDAQGTITAGNAAGINDGAAMLVVADLAVAKERGWAVLAKLGPGTVVGCDPARMGLGPVHAVRKLLSRGGALSDFDAIEINEAFAAQTLACVRELKLDDRRLNRHGGAIALGHPIAASGARLAVHLAHQIARGEISSGLATLCVGGGIGIAVSFFKP
jgi:acetyl-CoA C-acetyltransferase